MSARADRLPLALVAAAIALNLWLLYPQAAAPPPLNDGVLHSGLIERAAATFTSGESPLDHWNSAWVLGFPVFEYYQHLPHLAVAALYRLGGGREVLDWYNVALYLAVALLPAAIYLALRLMDFSPRAAAASAVCAPFLSTPALFGYDYASYAWRGSGLYTQAWAMSLFPLACGTAYRTIGTGRGLGWAVAMLSATLVSNVVYGYMAVLSIVALALVADKGAAWPARLGRLLLLLVLSALVLAYFLVPYVLNGAELNRSVWEATVKYDSYGHEQIVRWLFNGELLDSNRFPSLTLLAFVGLAHAVVRRGRADRAIVLLFVVWLALFFGRPTWGVLLRMLPLSNDLQFHRLIGGVHFAAIGLIGLGVEAIFAAGQRRRWQMVAAAAVIVAALWPVWQERRAYLADNDAMMARSAIALGEAAGDLERLSATLRGDAGAAVSRVYAGLPGTWGGTFTVGDVPIYAHLSLRQHDTLGYAYHAMSYSADVQYHFDDRNPAHYELFNIGWVVAPRSWAAPPFLSRVEDTVRWSVYRAPTRGYFAVVDQVAATPVVPGNIYAAAVEWLKGPRAAAAAQPDGAIGSVQGKRAAPASFSADVTVARPSYLLFKMTHHPWWRVNVDGRPRDLERLAPTYMGVAVAPGDRRVVFEYRPPAAKTWAFFLGLLLLVTIPLFERRLREKANAVAARVTRLPRMPTPRAGAIVLAIAVFAGLPLLQERVLTGHDSEKYPARLASFYQALTAGSIVPRWAADAAGGYGDPWPNFVAPLHSYAGSALVALGLPTVAASNLVPFCLLLAAAWATYRLMRRWFGTEAGVVAAAAFCCAPYTLLDLYVRGDYSEFLALALAPLLAAAIAALWRDVSPRRAIAPAAAIAAIVLSNLPAALILLSCVALAIAMSAFRPSSRRFSAALAASLAFGLALSAFYWLPAAMEKEFAQAEQMFQGWWRFDNHFVPWSRLVYGPWRYDYNQFPSTGETMTLEIGPWPLACAVVAAVMLYARGGKPLAARHAIAAGLGALGIATLMMTRVSLPVWEVVPLLPNLQFPWRFLIVGVCAIAVLAAAPLMFLKSGTTAARAWCVALVLVFLAYAYPRARAGGFLDNPSTVTTTLGEFAPVWAKTAPATPRDADAVVMSGQATLTPDPSAPRSRWTVDAAGTAAVRFNTRYFPGWELWVDGVQQPIRITESTGLMEGDMTAGRHAIELTKRRTQIEAAAELLSLAAFLTVLVLLVLTRAGAAPRAPDPA